MRTIEQHNEIVKQQVATISGMAISQAKQFGHPYLWNTSYWQGYCAALDSSGELFTQVKKVVLAKLEDLNS